MRATIVALSLEFHGNSWMTRPQVSRPSHALRICDRLKVSKCLLTVGMVGSRPSPRSVCCQVCWPQNNFWAVVQAWIDISRINCTQRWIVHGLEECLVGVEHGMSPSPQLIRLSFFWSFLALESRLTTSSHSYMRVLLPVVAPESLSPWWEDLVCCSLSHSSLLACCSCQVSWVPSFPRSVTLMCWVTGCNIHYLCSTIWAPVHDGQEECRMNESLTSVMGDMSQWQMTSHCRTERCWREGWVIYWGFSTLGPCPVAWKELSITYLNHPNWVTGSGDWRPLRGHNHNVQVVRDPSTSPESHYWRGFNIANDLYDRSNSIFESGALPASVPNASIYLKVLHSSEKVKLNKNRVVNDEFSPQRPLEQILMPPSAACPLENTDFRPWPIGMVNCLCVTQQHWWNRAREGLGYSNSVWIAPFTTGLQVALIPGYASGREGLPVMYSS